MKIKRYVVSNMKEACALIKEDLSPEAVIVNSRKIKQRGFKGLFLPRKLEVTAAVDENHVQKNMTNQPVYNEDEQIFTNQEMEKIRALLQKVSLKELDGKEVKKVPNNSLKSKLRKSLEELEIKPEIIDVILNDDGQYDLHSKESLIAKVATFIKPETRENHNSNVLIFVGPPGVGKTTTLAKLCAHFSLINNVDIGMITIDTYRIGAVQQLETYGEIMNVSVDVVMNPNEFKVAVEKNRGKDVILIDTAGRPSKNISQVIELKTYLDALDSVDIYLVLSSSTKDKDLMRMLNDYKVLNYSKLIFTKLDETDSLGSILNAAYITGLPVAYLTTGQGVPDDIEVGDPHLIAKRILEGVEI